MELASARNYKQLTTVQFQHAPQTGRKGKRPRPQCNEPQAQALATGIAMRITELSPDVIVLAGEVTIAWEQINLASAGFGNPDGMPKE